MNDKVSHARRWLSKAESDLTAARRLLEAGGPYDAVCFHAQQAAEKGLKAVLARADAPMVKYIVYRKVREIPARHGCVTLPMQALRKAVQAAQARARGPGL